MLADAVVPREGGIHKHLEHQPPASGWERGTTHMLKGAAQHMQSEVDGMTDQLLSQHTHLVEQGLPSLMLEERRVRVEDLEEQDWLTSLLLSRPPRGDAA